MSIRSLLESTFRRSAMWAYALNQSRAKVVMDPIYLTVAKRLLRNTLGPSAKLRAETFPPNLFFPYRAQSRKLQYFIEDWDWSQARPELLTPRQRQMMHTVALGETSGSAVADGFLRAFRTQPELAAFFGTWFTEELNHFVGYHMYLRQMGEAWPAAAGMAVAETDVLPYADDPMEVAACNMYQELLGFLIYRSFAKQVKDPFLAEMLSQFAKDECRHFKFYQDVVARHLQENPSFRPVVLKVFLKATSPYNQISGGPANVIDHLTMGAFYFRKREYEYFLRQVHYLLGTDLRPFWDWYFKGVVDPCTSCALPTVQCECEHYEDGNPAPIRNPQWWKQVSTAKQYDARIDIDEWARALIAMRGDQAQPTSPTAVAADN
jgi:hypothetical protein